MDRKVGLEEGRGDEKKNGKIERKRGEGVGEGKEEWREST